MSRWEKTLREDRYKQEKKNPSFSSTLLDEIYRSIDDGDKSREDLRFYGETTMQKKQSKSSAKSNRVLKEAAAEQEEISIHRRTCFIEKWMDKKVSEKSTGKQQKGQFFTEFERKSHHDHHDHDALFFSSTSSSSDSSSSGFSSSDTDSIYNTRSKSPSCLAPPRPNPVRTSVSARSDKTENTRFYQQREFRFFDDYRNGSVTNHSQKHEQGLIKSKSRAMKIYSNLKKVKQPISPGGRLANFINSLFTAGNTKKSSKNSSSIASCDDRNFIERQEKSGQVSTCSSASSFSRSCLSKNSPSTREKLRNGVKRSVRFFPVSVIFDEDCRPCGHKSLHKEEKEEEDGLGLMSVSVPTAWDIGKSPSRKLEDEIRIQVMEKSRRVEEMAREILNKYHQNQKKNDTIMRSSVPINYDDEDEDDDAASYSSSDLFELDHLAVIGNDRYCEELPVYETTHVGKNRAIANGLIM